MLPPRRAAAAAAAAAAASPPPLSLPPLPPLRARDVRLTHAPALASQPLADRVPCVASLQCGERVCGAHFSGSTAFQSFKFGLFRLHEPY